MKSATLGRKGKAKVPRERPGADKGRHPLAVLALGVLTLLAFSNCFQSGFILDNKGLLLDPRIREATGGNIALIFRHSYWWPSGETGLYRPFTSLSYLFNYAVLGDRDQPGGYHAVNLILHLGNVWLAYAVALHLLRRFWPAVLLAATWAVHPASTESVTNIVGRADLLAAMAVLAGLLLYIKSTKPVWLVGLALATTVGVFSKESAVMILPLIVVYEVVWWKERPQHRTFVWACMATALPIAAMFYVRHVVLAASAPAEFPFTDNPILGADWWTGRLTAMTVMARYVWLTFWPAGLSCDYSYNQIPLASATWLAYFAALAAAVCAVALYWWNRTAFFLACFAPLMLLPASNLLFPIGTIMADRLLYLPSFGLLGCLVLAVYAIPLSPRMAFVPAAALCLVSAGFAVRTWVRNLDWQSELTISTADLRVSPNSFKLHRLLASSLFEADPAHSNIDQVIGEQEKSIALLDPLPDTLSPPDAYRQAGYYSLIKARKLRSAELYSQAIRHLRRCIAINEAKRTQGDPQAYLLLSIAYQESGDPGKALMEIKRARELDPLNPQIYRQLSGVFYDEGQRPESQNAGNLEDALKAVQAGDWQDAADLSDRVLRFSPAEYPTAYLVNATANLHLGNLDAAEKAAREAIRIDTAHRNPRAGYVLGLVLAEKREYAQAAKLLDAYLNAAPDAADAEIVREQLRHIQILGPRY